MRLSQPRIEPVDLDRLDADQQAALDPFLATGGGRVGGGKILNIFRTLAHAPKALPVLAWQAWTDTDISSRPEAMAMAVVIALIGLVLLAVVAHGLFRREAQNEG